MPKTACSSTCPDRVQCADGPRIKIGDLILYRPASDPISNGELREYLPAGERFERHRLTRIDIDNRLERKIELGGNIRAAQLLLGFARAGTIANYFPSSVIQGMLTAIGIIIIMKQIPHALGLDNDSEGDLDFFEKGGENMQRKADESRRN